MITLIDDGAALEIDATIDNGRVLVSPGALGSLGWELHPEGLCPVALDKSVEDARPWIEAARPTHPSLVDTRHLVAELYNVVNVPTIVWIDERGRIVRPNDVAFGADTFRQLTGLDSSIHLGALRA